MCVPVGLAFTLTFIREVSIIIAIVNKKFK